MASEKRDLGGHLVTDYSKSPMDPQRAKMLNAAELDYVNGIMDDETDALRWPTYPELAHKYEIPVRVVQEQANKHKWVSRREQRKTALIIYKNELTRKRWQDMDRQIVDQMNENVAKLNFVVSRLVYEQTFKVERAMIEEQELRAAGDYVTLPEAGLRFSEVESASRALENIMKTNERIASRISNMPTVVADAELPRPMVTMEQEAIDREEAAEKVLPKSTLLDVYKEMMAIEAARAINPNLIQGEVLYPDEDEIDEIEETG